MSDSEDDLEGPEPFATSDPEGDAAEASDALEESDPEGEKGQFDEIASPCSSRVPRSADDVSISGKRYIWYSRAAYEVPFRKGGDKGSGLVRDRGGTNEVESVEELYEVISCVKNWPKGNKIHPLSIYVVRGRFGDELETDEDVDNQYVWYTRFSIRGQPDSHENMILRCMPRAVYKSVLDVIETEKSLVKSSLLKDYRATLENTKPLPMVPNGFKKAPHIIVEHKSRRHKKAEEPSVAATFEAHDARQPPAVQAAHSTTPEANDARSCAVEAAHSKKPADKAPLAKPPAPSEKTVKPPAKKLATMDQFAKPVKRASAAAAAAAAPPAAAAAAAAAPPAREEASCSSKRAASQEEALTFEPKRVCTLAFEDKEKVSVVWNGNVMHAIQF